MENLIENITKRKDGRFMGRFFIGYDINEKPMFQYVYGKTYEEAQEKVIIGKTIETRFFSKRNISVKKAYDEWLNYVVNRVKESSYANYKLKFENHILPEFGDMLCIDLSALAINAFIVKKLASGLSASYVRDIIVVFKTMLKYAQEEYDFKLSLKNITLPKCEKKEPQKINGTEQDLLIKYLKKNMNLTSFGVLISLLMGLRIGELCGLKWCDVDFQNRILHINRTVQRVSVPEGNRKTKVIVSSPKSQTSRRSISIPDHLMEYFKKFKSNNNFYILSGCEDVIEPRTMQYRYKKILTAAQISSHNYHQLRHTFATNCMQNGFDIKTLSNILGHSNVSMTLNRYIHPDIFHERSLMNKMCMLL